MRALIKLGILTTIAIITIILTVAAQNGTSSDEVLTNENVITMVKASLPSSLIVNKIRTSKNNFNTSTGELIRLQQLRVPAEILNAMVDASSSTSTAASRSGAGDVSKADPNDPIAAHEAGIYLFEDKTGERRMTKLEPSISTQAKSGGFLTHAITYGNQQTCHN